jgi:hypothetical protein
LKGTQAIIRKKYKKVLSKNNMMLTLYIVPELDNTAFPLQWFVDEG